MHVPNQLVSLARARSTSQVAVVQLGARSVVRSRTQRRRRHTGVTVFDSGQVIPTVNRSGGFCWAVVALSLLFLATGAQASTPAEASPNRLIEAGQYQLAADALNRLLQETHIPGQETSDSAALLSNLGMVYEKLGRYPEAESTLVKSVQIFKDLGITQGQNYRRSLNNLANVYLSEHRYTKAEEMFRDVLDLSRQDVPQNYADMALVLNNLGLANLGQRNYPRAEQLFREALDLHRKTKQENNELAVTLNNTALVCKLQNRLSQAADLYAQAIEVWRRNNVATRPEICIGLHNLASLQSSMGDTKAAASHFEEALSIASATLPPGHPTRTAIMESYAALLHKLGRKREAKQLLAGVRTLRAQQTHATFQDLTVDVHNLGRNPDPAGAADLLPKQSEGWGGKGAPGIAARRGEH